MTTETLTYAFGTTPEEVIRERHHALQDQSFGRASQSAHAPAPAIWWMPADDLITVLDALRQSAASVNAIASDESSPYHRDLYNTEAGEYANLRIEILASLGIEES